MGALCCCLRTVARASFGGSDVLRSAVRAVRAPRSSTGARPAEPVQLEPEVEMTANFSPPLARSPKRIKTRVFAGLVALLGACGGQNPAASETTLDPVGDFTLATVDGRPLSWRYDAGPERWGEMLAAVSSHYPDGSYVSRRTVRLVSKASGEVVREAQVTASGGTYRVNGSGIEIFGGGSASPTASATLRDDTLTLRNRDPYVFVYLRTSRTPSPP